MGGLEVTQELDDLALYKHVEPGRWLVGYQ
jgi:hypothetical protein